MAVPKKKTSKARMRMRRSHDALVARSLSTCPQCGEVKEPHRVCGSCGHYKGQQIFLVEAEDEV